MFHLFYLHGLASSPSSSKAKFFRQRFSDHGLTLNCPDLNEPDYSSLTTSRMISQVVEELRDLKSAPIVLIGSSLGAFVALHLAEQAASGQLEVLPISRLVLLAPALDFGRSKLSTRDDYEALKHWRESGWVEMMHYSYGEKRRVHYKLYEDAGQYDSFATTVAIPTLILQGSQDEVVEPSMVKRFAETRTHVRLVMLEDGHQLKANLDQVWAETASFLGFD